MGKGENKAKGFTFWPTDWLTATRHLDDATYTAYHKLLCWMWLEGPDHCKCPDDLETLAIATGCKGKKLEKVLHNIKFVGNPLVKTDSGFLVSNGLKKQAERQAQVSETRRLAGQQGGRPRSDEKKAKGFFSKSKTKASNTNTNTLSKINTERDKDLLPTLRRASAQESPVSRTDSRTVPCPKCAASIGDPCMGERGKQRESSHMERVEAHRALPFEQFWAAYPRKVGKGKCRAWWYKRNPDSALTQTILHAIEQHRSSRQWTQNGGQFIPHPLTWLNREGWHDEPEISDEGHFLGPEDEQGPPI